MENKTALILNQKYCDPINHYQKVQACIDYCSQNKLGLHEEVAYDSYSIMEVAECSDFQVRPDLCFLRKKHCTDIVFLSVIDLGLSTLGMMNLIAHVKEEGIALHCVTNNADVTTPVGRLLLQLFAISAEYERNTKNEIRSDELKLCKM